MAGAPPGPPPPLPGPPTGAPPSRLRPSDAGDEVRAVLARVDDLGGDVIQLQKVTEVARGQVRQAQDDPAVGRDPGLDLWRLREPGYLRALVDVEPPRVNNALVLLPVLLSWLVLGLAELAYRRTTADAGGEPAQPFFAAWMSGPLLLSPVMLSLVIFASVGWLMWRYNSTSNAHADLDRLDREVRDIEIALLEPLVRFRRQCLRSTVEGTQQRSADALFEASRQLRETAEQLTGSLTAAQDLRSVLARLLDELPDVGAQAVRLGRINDELRDAADHVAAETRPLTDLVSTAAEGAVALGAAMASATATMERAQRLESTMAEQNGVVDVSGHPFVEASERMAVATRQLADVARIVHETSATLCDAVQRVNYFSLVVDGIRNPEPPPDRPRDGRGAPA